MEYRIDSPNDLLHEEECAWQEDKDEKCPGNGLYKGLVRGSKSSSQLGRNTVDALSACRKLKDYNGDVYFQNADTFFLIRITLQNEITG